ncbi:MAG: SHOCT domain-containing protein [Candidatus Methanoperedens sp.]|nr:SHOCT domain-containing protein [Candidatus Methanoperedens sp.]
MNGYGYGYSMMGGGHPIIGFIFCILVLIGLVLLIKYLWGGGAKRGNSALEILKKRYASGEIRKEEFEEKKKDLI